jgi:hypothetical protein
MTRHFIYKSPKLNGKNVMSKAQNKSTNASRHHLCMSYYNYHAQRQNSFIGVKNVHVQRHYSQFWTSTLQLKKKLKIHFTSKWQIQITLIEYYN